MLSEGNQPYTPAQIEWLMLQLTDRYGVSSDKLNSKGFTLTFDYDKYENTIIIKVNQSPEADLALLTS